MQAAVPAATRYRSEPSVQALGGLLGQLPEFGGVEAEGQRPGHQFQGDGGRRVGQASAAGPACRHDAGHQRRQDQQERETPRVQDGHLVGVRHEGRASHEQDDRGHQAEDGGHGMRVAADPRSAVSSSPHAHRVSASPSKAPGAGGPCGQCGVAGEEGGREHTPSARPRAPPPRALFPPNPARHPRVFSPSSRLPPHPSPLSTESPQWRRGPPATPILCNACGTRFRRSGGSTAAAGSSGSGRAGGGGGSGGRPPLPVAPWTPGTKRPAGVAAATAKHATPCAVAAARAGKAAGRGGGGAEGRARGARVKEKKEGGRPCERAPSFVFF